MNNEEAKFILQGYRPNGADAGDATFAAALEQVRTDPPLSEWFAREQSFDAAVSAKLAEVQPPPALRAAILAGVKVSTMDDSRRPAWRQPVWMAAAASVALMIAAGLALWPNRAEALTEFALEDARLSAIHGGHGHESNVLQAVLNDPRTRLGTSLPIQFGNLLETGCRTVSCQGHDVLELCFTRNGVWFHAYIGRRSDFPGVGTANIRISDHGSTSMATWLDGQYVVVVVSKTGRKNLEALL